jgi:hypothetical protein
MRTCSLLLAASLLGMAGEAAAQIAILNSTVQEASATPGESYSGTIIVRNTTSEPHELKVYQTDYAFHADGTTLYSEPGSMPRSNAAWISISPSYVVLPPEADARIQYRVTVPAAGVAPKSGTHWSMLMVEPIARGSAESAHRALRGKRSGVGIQTHIRYGVQVVTHLGTEGVRTLQFAGTRTTGARNEKTLEFDLVNTGELAYRPTLRVELYDREGNPTGKFETERGLLYPGTSLRQRFELGALPAGSYHALVIADVGGESIFGARYQLKF